MFSKSDLEGDVPTQAMSFNPSKLLVYKGFVVLAITIIAATWGAGAIIANIMTTTAQINFEHRLEEELAKDGKIHILIHSIAVEEGQDSDDRLLRIETMLDPMYESITGHRAPERVRK